MRYRNFTIFAGIAGLASAAPAATEFSTSCTDLEIIQGWLVGNCLTGGNGSSSLKSSVFLPNKIVNNEANLEWKSDGKYWGSCNQCVLQNSKTLSCYCTGTVSASSKTTTIDLEEKIANHQGHLLSSLNGEPTIPSTPPKYDVPSDFRLDVWWGPTNNTCATGQAMNLAWPDQCYTFRVAPQPAPFASVKNVVNNGWEYTAYQDDSCSGIPIDMFTPEDDSCKDLETIGTSFRVKALWNAA